MMKCVAFAPGHVTGFFEPYIGSQNLERNGSVGAGINVSLGAVSEVFVQASDRQTVEVFVNNKESKAPVTRYALKYLLGNRPLNVLVKTSLCLPMGQGFGMSAAGALSATYALVKILCLPKENAIRASHCAELSLRTGLGDVVASMFGGVEIRKKPGLPPWGVIEHIPGEYDVVFCIVGRRVNTQKVLTDPSKLSIIREYGNICIKKLLEKPSLENFFRLSQFFTMKTGLANKCIIETIETANKHGMSSMCMLGNSVFAVGNTDKLCTTLSEFGKVYVCHVDQCGARILEE